jgi:hypothetical protein
MNVAIRLLLIAAAIETNQALVTTLNRGTMPWTQERVKALLNAGNISADMLPDFQAVKPTDIAIDSYQLYLGREMVMFSNSIANTGVNNLQVRLGDLITNPDQTLIDYLESLGLDVDSVRLASQELLDANKNVAVVIPDATLSNYHHSHNHIHVAETAKFSLEHFNDSTAEWGVVSGRSALKQYFCLMDTDQIRPVNGSSDPDYYERHYDGTTSYNGCSDTLQGVSNGGMDYYSAGLPGQQVNICGLAAGIYRIIVTLNPSGWFLESNYSNNVGWASFELERDNEGLPTVSEIPESKGGIWFEEVKWPTYEPWPTSEPTKSPSPTATFSPSMCTGNTPNWVHSWYGEGCDSFEEYDLPGCPYYGNYGDEESGTAMDNCCYCKLSQSPTNSPYPTYSEFEWPTFEPTKSPSPTATFSPSMCTGNTPNWVHMWYGEGCDLFEEYDLPGCPRYGNDGDEESGTAMDNCCYCKLSQSPTKSLSPTYYTTPYPQYPTFEPTKSPSPTATFSPSMCTGNTPNWVHMWFDLGCDWFEEYDLPGCPYYGNYGDEESGTAMDNCCYCKLSQSPTNSPHPTYYPTPYPTNSEICRMSGKSTKEPSSLEPTTMKPSTLKPTTMKPSTLEPTTMKPSTMKPTTMKPSTMKPTTMKPSTLKPTTMKPSTMKPTTMKPSTMKPTTAKPSTMKPTTAKPTPKPTSTKPSTMKPSTKKPLSSKPTSKKPLPTMTGVFT